ncbi:MULTISPECIES: ABC transporter substrate-binding protein [Halomonadaceae]|uniref:ABC transporter substrate-binding protein n=1 Tax=Halomonadaceae TaxID=28256 RepID=UPI0015838377|nr:MULTISPECIES: ABC transporter substrate-binding protein [Halomonas]MDI4638281.1 ABC transporter substrate-binding protein [Halomonas sp. BMC7]NUJ59272.1 ABC transporter substrate-binding protein [Halomonas taeanensis]
MTTCSMLPSRRTARLARLLPATLMAATLAIAPAWAQSADDEAPAQAPSATEEAQAGASPQASSAEATGGDSPSSAKQDAASDSAPKTSEAVVDVPSVVQGSPEPIEPPPTRELRLVLDWYPSPQHAALLIAQAHGELKRRGVSLTIITPADPSVPAKLVAAGRADLAVGREPQLHMLIDKGLPLVRVATLIDTPLSSLIVREDSDITDITDLAGKTLGYAFQDSINPTLATMLNHHGMTLNDVTVEKIDFAMVRALAEKSVDALIGAPRNVIPALLGQEGLPTRRFLPEEHGLPLHDGLVLIANRDHLSAKRDDIDHLLAALEEATNWMINHPDQAWQLLVKQEPSLDSDANQQAWQASLRRMSPSPAQLNVSRYATFETFLKKKAFIDEATPIKRLAVDPSSS